MNDGPIDYQFAVSDIPADAVLSRARIHTKTNSYDVYVVIDGDWLTIVRGPDWITDRYGARFVRLEHDWQSDASGELMQYFRTADKAEHNGGEFVTITFPKDENPI